MYILLQRLYNDFFYIYNLGHTGETKNIRKRRKKEA